MKLLHHVHHTALRCLDAEQTKWFWHDVMGLKIAGAVKITEDPGTKQPCNYLHIFFETGDGNFIAFFDDPTTLRPEHKQKKHPFDFHLALEVETMDELLAWQKYLNEKGVQCLGPVNHDFVHSIYMFDPNGLNVEITVRDVQHDQFLAHEAAIAEDVLQRWTRESRAQKVEVLGNEAIDSRKTKFFK